MSEQNGASPSPAKVVVHNMADLAHDAVTIAELQTELLRAELGENLVALTKPLVLVVIAGLLLLGCIPVLLMGLAYLLNEFAGLSQGWSTLIVAVATIIVACVGAMVGVQRLQRQSLSLERSRAEFSRNVTWVKQVLKVLSGVNKRSAKSLASPRHMYNAANE